MWLWPLVAATAFRALPVSRAVPLCAIIGFLLLPSGMALDLPGLPDLDKDAVVLLGIVVVYLRQGRPANSAPLPGITIGLFALLLATPLLTAVTNGDPLGSQSLYIPGMTLYDGVGILFFHGLIIATVVIGARTLAREEDHRAVLALFGAAMVLYSLPALLELRISPQLHRWIYGFHPFSFGQQVREGGFRSTVLLEHGLELAMALALSGAALLAIRRSSTKVFGCRPHVLSAYLFLVLVLQKSLGALMIASVVNTLLLVVRPRGQVAVAAVIAVLFLAYPIPRGADAIPVDWLNGVVASRSVERSQSFTTRTVNEDQLLAKANERPWFGWGNWGRNRVYNLDTGADASITDGTWIIVLGSLGWCGYLGFFGLMATPIIMLFRHRKRLPAATAGLAVMLAANLIDLIPNSSVTPLTWLMAGALTGAVAVARRREDPAAAGPETSARSAARPAGSVVLGAPLPQSG